MSAEFYNEMAQMAYELLAEYGTEITLVRETGAKIDRLTGEIEEEAEIEELKAFGMVRSYTEDQIDGTRIKAGDKQLILDHSVEPLSTDLVKRDSENWAIKEIVPVKPSIIPIVYLLRIRK